ncbi:MAG: DUF5107 domain-containing protein [Bacteroidales bacterium]|nr:DUF5107 domain-containing protein [Bacteroidales bacterium]
MKTKYKLLSLVRNVLPFVLILTGQLLTAQVSLTEREMVLPTYTVITDKNPVFFRNEAFQGASRHYYPLALNDQYTNERKMKAWKAVVLENQFIELVITPEIGGKLYHAKDKTNDYHFVYKNDAVKPSNIGMTGAWVSGGIEWCVLHHHRASTYLPVDYTTEEHEDGSKTIWVAEHEPRHGMRWTVGVTVFPGKSYFKAEGRIFNSSPFTHSFLYWANVAVHTNENYQTIFPPNAQVVTFHSKTDFSHWPISTEVYRGSDFSAGVDISWWKNTRESGSFFIHELQEDFMGGYDHGRNSGIVHIGDHHIVKGAKLWQWGSGPRGQATEARLTENSGPYVELMTGAYSDNQPDYSWIRPYEVKKWEQYWYPVKGIRGFKDANLNGAVNLEEEKRNGVFLGYYTTRLVDRAKVVLKNKNEIVYEKVLMISPETPFNETIKLEGKFDLTDLHTELLDMDTGESLISYQPVKLETVEELPADWEGYPEPQELETVEELYLTGKRVEQFYAPRYDEMDWYREALERDPNDIRTNTAVGHIYLKNGNYQTARTYLTRAIARLAKDYTRPSDCEAFYLLGLAQKRLGLYNEAIDTLYRATWDYAYHSPAYYQLAQISSMRGDFDRALDQINESLWTNARNNSAIALKASIQRRMGDSEGARATLTTVYGEDPLDFRIRNEYVLIARESGNHQIAEGLLLSLEKEMRDYADNYLQLAVGYINDGFLSEAEEVLNRFDGNHPVVDYYLGYIYDQYGEREQAIQNFNTAEAQPVDAVFPYRLETVEVLKTALKYNPQDGRAYYYMGNILYEKQPEQAIAYWESAVENNPELAVAFRNIGWGYHHHYEDVQKAIQYYEKAISLDDTEAIYYAELDDLYEMKNSPVETRLKLFSGKNAVVRKRDDAFISQIEVLTLAGYPERAVENLEGVEFAYREGSSNVRNIIINAQLMMGIKYLDEGDYQNALRYFLEAQVPEEEAGNPRFGNRDIQVNYYIGLAHENLGNRAQAREFFQQAANKESIPSASTMTYYKGLSHAKIGNKERAKEVFESMVTFAEEQLREGGTSEAGVIFGAREAENVRLSELYTIRGLGYKGLGQSDQAKRDLQKAVDLSYSNLWAKAES